MFHRSVEVPCGCDRGKVKVQKDISGDYDEVDCTDCGGSGYVWRAVCAANCEGCK